MKYYLKSGAVFAFAADGSQDAYIPVDALLIDEQEAIEIAIPQSPVPTQFEKDQNRYVKRAAAKDGLIAFMAADNMSRVRSGVWTVPDLVALSSAPEMAALLGDVNTLSFELAVQRLSSISHPMLTPAIKADWAEKLTSHFYLVP